MAAAFAVFMAINAYFMIISPSAIGSVFALFGTGTLVVYGTNVMQYFAAFYPVSYPTSAIISLIVYAYLLALFYLYNKSLKLFLGIMPALIFFLSWRSITVYGLPCVILILAVYYTKNLEKREDMMKSKNPIYASLAAIVIAVTAIIIYSHQSYLAQNTLVINKVTPILYSLPQYGSGYLAMEGLIVNVTNNNNVNENVSFYIIARSPNNEGYVLGSELRTLPPRSSYNYSLSYQLGLVGNTTQLFIMAFSSDYTTSTHFAFGNLSRGSGST
jgi:uncharacterized membrane protein